MPLVSNGGMFPPDNVIIWSVQFIGEGNDIQDALAKINSMEPLSAGISSDPVIVGEAPEQEYIRVHNGEKWRADLRRGDIMLLFWGDFFHFHHNEENDNPILDRLLGWR